MGKTYQKTCVYCSNQITYLHKNKPTNCPHCKERDWSKPATETDLFLLQRDFLRTRDNKYLGEMFLILRSYAASLIKKLVSGNLYNNETWIDEKSSDAANLMIDYYLEKKDFRIKDSFAGYLRWKVREALYSTKKEDFISLQEYIKSSDTKERIDTPVTAGFKSAFGTDLIYKEEEHNIRSFLDGIFFIINRCITVIREVHSPLIAIQVLIGLKGKIDKKNDVFFTRFYTESDYKVKEFVEKIELLMYQYCKMEC